MHDHQPTTHLLHKFGYQRRSRETHHTKDFCFIRNCAPKSSDFEELFLKIAISCTLPCPSRLIKRRKLCRLHYIHRQTNTPFMILFIFRCVISAVLESNTHKPPLSSQMYYYNLGIVSCIEHCQTIAHIMNAQEN